MKGAARRAFILRAPWRVPCAFAALVLAAVVAYALWRPGDRVTDGRHDRARNGLWLGHAWLGDDAWFVRNGKAAQMAAYRNDDRLHALAMKLAAHGIRDVYPHLCPAGESGVLPDVDPAQVERFLDHVAAPRRVLPWVGGVFGASARIEDPAWRKTFCESVGALLTAHPRLAGVQVNVEPCRAKTRRFWTCCVNCAWRCRREKSWRWRPIRRRRRGSRRRRCIGTRLIFVRWRGMRISWR